MVTKYNVVHDRYIQKLTSVSEFFGELPIIMAGAGIAGRVVVNKNDRTGHFVEGILKDDLGVNYSPGYATAADFSLFDHLIVSL